MPDSNLEEIWRVRELLIKRYGGLDGLLDHAQKLERAHRRRKQAKKRKKVARKPVARTRSGR
jgi:hypothetical protein